MADSAGKSILLALAARLEQIRTFTEYAPGTFYSTDAGEHVRLGRATTSKDDKRPNLVLVPGGVDIIERQLDGSGDRRRWALTVGGLLDFDSANPLEIYDLVADIKRALFRVDERTLGGLVLDVETAGAESVADPEEGGTVAGCTVPISVLYDESYGAP